MESNGMLIAHIPGVVDVERAGTMLIARLLQPCLVASTSTINGGLRTDVTALYNHQCCEPVLHHEKVGSYLTEHEDDEHDMLCAAHGLDADRTACMGTAASMRCLGVGRRQFREVEVLALATAGVDGNAGRAGDPAGFIEWDGAFESVSQPPRPVAGTINTMVFYSHELLPGTLVRSLMTATEAKTTVLNDLVVGSRYSSGLATGTGTDLYAAACPRGQSRRPLSIVGKHSMLGQLTAEAVREAIFEALALQNGITPSNRRAVSVQLRRFGFCEQDLFAVGRRVLTEQDAALFEANYAGVDRDPITVAAVAGLSTVLDQISSGVLPGHCRDEILQHYARMIVDAASMDTTQPGDFEYVAGASPLDVVYVALAKGFARKWTHLHDCVDSGGEKSFDGASFQVVARRAAG